MTGGGGEGRPGEGDGHGDRFVLAAERNLSTSTGGRHLHVFMALLAERVCVHGCQAPAAWSVQRHQPCCVGVCAIRHHATRPLWEQSQWCVIQEPPCEPLSMHSASPRPRPRASSFSSSSSSSPLPSPCLLSAICYSRRPRRRNRREDAASPCSPSRSRRPLWSVSSHLCHPRTSQTRYPRACLSHSQPCPSFEAKPGLVVLSALRTSDPVRNPRLAASTILPYAF